MVWFWTKDDATLCVETRYDNDALMYVAKLRWSDGREQTERFLDGDSFRRRLEALEAELASERWVHVGPPALLPDGWPKKPPRR